MCKINLEEKKEENKNGQQIVQQEEKILDNNIFDLDGTMMGEKENVDNSKNAEQQRQELKDNLDHLKKKDWKQDPPGKMQEDEEDKNRQIEDQQEKEEDKNEQAENRQERGEVRTVKKIRRINRKMLMKSFFVVGANGFDESSYTIWMERIAKKKSFMQADIREFVNDFMKVWDNEARAMLTSCKYDNEASFATCEMAEETKNMHQFCMDFLEYDENPRIYEILPVIMKFSNAIDCYYITMSNKRTKDLEARALYAKAAMQLVDRLMDNLCGGMMEMNVYENDERNRKDEEKESVNKLKELNDAYQRVSKNLEYGIATPKEKNEQKLLLFSSYERYIKIFRDSNSRPSSFEGKIDNAKCWRIVKEYELCKKWQLLGNWVNENDGEVDYGRDYESRIAAHIKANQRNGLFEDESQKLHEMDDTLSAEQLKGIEEIDQWLLRNACNGGLAGVFFDGVKKQFTDFISILMKKSKRERLYMYYLVQTTERVNPTPFSVVKSQTGFVPNVKEFESKVVSSKALFVQRLSGGYMKIHKVSEAYQIARQQAGLIGVIGELEQGRTRSAGSKATDNMDDQRLDAIREIYTEIKAYRDVYIKYVKAGGAEKKKIANEVTAQAKKTKDLWDGFLKNKYFEEELIGDGKNENEEDKLKKYEKNIHVTVPKTKFEKTKEYVDNAYQTANVAKIGAIVLTSAESVYNGSKYIGERPVNPSAMSSGAGAVKGTVDLFSGLLMSATSIYAYYKGRENMTGMEKTTSIASISKWITGSLNSLINVSEKIIQETGNAKNEEEAVAVLGNAIGIDAGGMSTALSAFWDYYWCYRDRDDCQVRQK